MPQCAHSGIDQYLRDRIFRSRIEFALVGLIHGVNKISGMIIRDKLECSCDAFNQILLFYDGHSYTLTGNLLLV